MVNLSAKLRDLMSGVAFGLIGTASVAWPSTAMAQEGHRGGITIPSLPLGEAIGRIATQSGTRVGFDPDAVKGLTSHPVRNAKSAHDALQQATHGLNIAIVPAANGGLTVVNDIVVTAQRDEAETSVLVRRTTTSDRNGLGLRDQPRNTQVISAKTIQDQQALDITDILRNAGGVSSQINNPNSGASYTVRGFNATGLVNGLAGGSQYGVSSGSNQPVANIERVEILKGPDALLSGFGNLGGNVNVVTKKPSADERLAVSFDTGSFGLVRGVLDANEAITADKKLSARVIASGQTMDHSYGGYTGNRNGLFAPSLRYKDRLTDIVVGASLSTSTTGLSAYTIFDPKTRQIVDRDPSVPIYSPNQSIRVNTDRFYFDATRQITPGIDFVARGLHDQNQLTLQVYQLNVSKTGLLTAGVGGSQQLGTSNALDSFLRIKAHVGSFLKARFNVGYNYSEGYSDQRSGTTYKTVVNPPIGANTSMAVIPFSPLGPVQVRTEGRQEGVYGQALFEFWKIKLLGGVRQNWFETKSTFFVPGIPPQAAQNTKGTSPSAGAIFDVTSNLSIFGNYTRGVQAIFALDRNRNPLPNTISTNKEAGIKFDLFHKRATINASYFDILQNNVIVRDPFDNTLSPGPGQRGRGLDLNITGQVLPGWTVMGSLTRTNYKLLTTTAASTTVPRQPRDTYSVYTNYRTRISDGVSGGGSIGLYGRSSSYADTLGQYVVPPARQVDVNGFMSFAGFDVNLGIRNIFNRRNYNAATLISYIPVDEPRNIRLSFTKRLF